MRSRTSAFALRGYGGQVRLASHGGNTMPIFTYVYRIISTSSPTQIYTGLTQDLDARFRRHNTGDVSHASKYIPWELELAIAFKDRTKASAFECYLKTGSGREFARRHF